MVATGIHGIHGCPWMLMAFTIVRERNWYSWNPWKPRKPAESMEIHGPGGFCMAARNSPLSNVRKLQVHEALKTNVYWSANLFTNAMHQLSLCAWKPPCLLGAQPFCLTANQALTCFEEIWHKACHFGWPSPHPSIHPSIHPSQLAVHWFSYGNISLLSNRANQCHHCADRRGVISDTLLVVSSLDLEKIASEPPGFS